MRISILVSCFAILLSFAGVWIEAFDFVPIAASVHDNSGLRVVLNPAQPNALVFRTTDKRYQQILASCLKNLLAELDR